jgi:hypothetical protein
MLTDIGGRRHRLAPGMFARDSLSFTLFLPEENLAVTASRCTVAGPG